MRLTTTTLLIGLCHSLGTGLGCDGQAGPEYRGEPLAVLRGTVNNQSGIPPRQQMDAALLWHVQSATTPDAIMSATPVLIEKLFPAQFTITIYLPAPANVLSQSSLPYAVANVGAIEHGASPDQIASGAAILGRLADPRLYYFRSDLPRGGLWEREYGALKGGYHLVHRQPTVDPATLTPSQIEACATALTAELKSVRYADAQIECTQSLLSQTSQELPLTTPVLLQVDNP